MKQIIRLILTLMTAAVFTTALQAQTGVARWSNATLTGAKRGLAYNPATDNLIVVIGGAPGSIKRIKASDGTSAGSDLAYPTGGSGTYHVGGVAAASDGTLYGCNYASSGTQQIYQWSSESATPTVLWSGTYLTGEAGSVGANLAVYGTGNNAVFVLSSTSTGGLVVYHNGSVWTARAITVVNQTLTSGLTFLDKEVAGPGQYRLMAKTGQTGGQIYTFDPTAGSGAISPTATAMSDTFAYAANGLHGIAYDPVTGLIGAITRVSSTSPFPGTNLLFNTGLKVGSATLTKPTELWRATFTGSTAGDGGAPGGAAWGKGAFFTSAANPGNNLFAWDVTAFLVSDISPAAATKHLGESITFSVVSGGSRLTYQWKKDGAAISGATTSSLAIPSVAAADAGSYTCTVSGVSGSSWTSGTGVLSLLQDTTTALTSSGASSTYGSAVTFTATVLAATGTPTGTVTFNDGTASLGTVHLSAAGTAEFSTSALSVLASPHSITATYNGDSTYNRSTSDPAPQTVTPKTLVPGVTVGNKAYDANLAAIITGRSLEGVVATDDVTLDGSGTTAFPSKLVGDYTLTVMGLALSGTQAGNYVLATDTVTASASITPKALLITSLTVDDKTYDRTTTAAFTGSALLSGVIGTEDVSLSGSAAAAFPSAAVGTYNLTLTGFALLGADIANYTLAPLTQTAKITPKALTPDGLFATDKVYDGTLTNINLVFNVATLPGVIAPDDVTLAPLSAIGYTTNKAIGSQFLQVTNFQLTGADAANYAVVEPFTAQVNVTARTLNVSATATSKTYDGSDAAAVTLTSDPVAWDDVVVAYSAAAFSDKNAGTAKAVTVNGVSLSGADAPNYALSTNPVTATAEITPVALSVTGVSANPKSYDGTATATLAGTAALSSGVVNGEDVTLGGTASALFDNAKVGTAKPVTVTGYTLTGEAIANYTLEQPTGLTADITPAASATALLSSRNPSTNGDSVTFTATVSWSAGAPTGNVVFLTNGVTMATVALSSGSASATTADLPVGTITVRAEYAAQDNWQASADSLSQEVRSAVTLSTTNTVLSLVATGGGLYTLNCLGTPDAQYYVVAGSDLHVPVSQWTALVGSTNTAASPSGLWSFQVSNAAPAFYRSVAIHPAP